MCTIILEPYDFIAENSIASLFSVSMKSPFGNCEKHSHEGGKQETTLFLNVASQHHLTPLERPNMYVCNLI